MRRAMARVGTLSLASGGYRVDTQGLSCAFQFRMWGERRHRSGGVPSLFHRGTPLVDMAEAKIPATGYLEFNERLAPTGKVVDAQGTDWDYRDYRRVGSRRFNHCYVGLERGPMVPATASFASPQNREPRSTW